MKLVVVCGTGLKVSFAGMKRDGLVGEAKEKLMGSSTIDQEKNSIGAEF